MGTPPGHCEFGTLKAHSVNRWIEYSPSSRWVTKTIRQMAGKAIRRQDSTMGITVWALAGRAAPEGVHPDEYSLDLGLKFSQP
jgi:hypothetical protein